MSTEPYYERIKRLRRERGLSQPELFRHTAGIGFDMVRALEMEPTPATDGRRPRWRYPSMATLEALAPVLGVSPEEFPEYRLAKARRLLDERAIGLHEALANLQAFGLADLVSEPSAAAAAAPVRELRAKAAPLPAGSPHPPTAPPAQTSDVEPARPANGRRRRA